MNYELVESRTSSWSNLDLRNQSLIFVKKGLKFSLGPIDSRIRNSIGNLLLHLVLGNSNKSLIVLLHNVESRFKFTKLGSQISIVGHY